MKAFVAGSTGQTGRRIVEELLQNQIEVKALVRDINKAQQILPQNVELIQGDVLKPESFKEALKDCNFLLCATGATPSFDVTAPYQVDYIGTKNLVDLAKNQGIEHFVFVSSLCVSQFFHPLNLFWLVLYWKKQAEIYLQNSGLNYTIVRPGGLKNEDYQNPLVMSGADTLFEGVIPRRQVAHVCVAALSQVCAKNKIVEIITKSDAQPQTLENLFANI